MKPLSTVITAVIIAAMSLSCTSVFGAENSNAALKRPAFVKTEMNAQRKGLADEKKTAMLEKMKAGLSARLEAGKITQEQYDKIIKSFESGKMPPVGKFNKNIKGAKPFRKPLTDEDKAAMLEKAKADLAARLEAGKITQEQYDKIIESLESGKMPPVGKFNKNIKGAKPFRKPLTDEDKAAMLEKAKTDLAARLEAGKITQEQYDKIIKSLESGKMPFGAGPGNFIKGKPAFKNRNK